jgi:two-component system, NarL family, sensor kinase
MFFKAFLTTFFSLSCFFVFSQVDSLENVLKFAKEDTNKVQTLNKISAALCFEDFKKAEDAAQKSLALSQKLNYKKGIAFCNKVLGVINVNKGSYQLALEYYDKALKNYGELKDKKGISDVLNNIGLVHQNLGNYSKAIVYHYKSLKIREEIGNKKGIAGSHNNIGLVYESQKMHDKALVHYFEALKIDEELQNLQEMANVCNNIAVAYDYANSDLNARKYYLRTIEVAQKINYNYLLSTVYNNLATLYVEDNDFQKAFDYHFKALSIRKEMQDSVGLAQTFNNLGKLTYKSGGNPTKAIEYLNEGLKIAKKMGIKNEIFLSYDGLVQASSKIEHADNTYTYALLYSEAKDSILNIENGKQIAEMQTRYETEKKEKENSELKRKNEIQQLTISAEKEKRKNELMLSFAFTGLLGVSGFFIYNRRKLKQKAMHLAELGEQEKLRFKAVIDAEEKERSRIAQELHDGLGQLLSTARLNVAGLEDSVIKEDKPYLDKSLKIIDEACTEIRNISHNMMPNALIRMGLISAIRELVENINTSKVLKIDFSTNVSGSLGKSLDITIYRIVQEILNNMIRHSKANLINMEINKTNNNLLISMRDNGIGFNTDDLKESTGLGWKNIFSRVSMLNGTIELDSKPKEGTIVYINLELKNA